MNDQINRALAMLERDRQFAALELSTLHRCGGSKTRQQIDVIVQEYELGDVMKKVNGNYVVRM